MGIILTGVTFSVLIISNKKMKNIVKLFLLFNTLVIKLRCVLNNVQCPPPKKKEIEGGGGGECTYIPHINCEREITPY